MIDAVSSHESLVTNLWTVSGCVARLLFCCAALLLVQYVQDTSSKCPKPSYSTVCYTQKGLAYYSDWGTLRNTGNMMFMAALMGKHGQNKGSALCFARNQMRYILGSDTGKSYLIGFGSNQPQRPHHRQSACSARYNEPCTPSDGGTCCAGERGE